MGTFSEPTQDLPRLRDDLEQRIRRECQSVQATYLAGQKCYWQLRQQEDPARPYFARALDKEHNTILYTICFDVEGRLTPNRLPQETAFPIGPRDPFARVQEMLAEAARNHAATLGLAPTETVFLRKGWSAVRGDNPLRLVLTVAELPLNVADVEQQISTSFKALAEKNSIANLPPVSVLLETAVQAQKQGNRAKTSSSPKAASPRAPVKMLQQGELLPNLKKKSSRGSIRDENGPVPRSPVSRRVSSTAAGLARNSSSPKVSTPTAPDRPQSHTISSIAKEFFERDIASHGELAGSAKVAVILHDSCYGHRFSRPRTSKASLSTIVERPERMLAITLGVSAAYVLLGGRYAGSVHPPHPDHAPHTVPFIIRKSTRFVPLTSPAVTNVHGTKWMNELKMMCEGAETKLAMNGKELVRPQDGDLEKPKFHEGDLYLCAESLDAFEGALGGVLDAVDTVFDVTGPKAAFVGIRPPGHHCSADYPAGFCWLNNVHVGISHAAAVHGLTHAAMIDFDLHHGDGSQTIAWAHNARVSALPKNAPFSKRSAIGYFSLHDINSYPCEWGDEEKVQAASLCIENAHGQTIWNTHLQPWKTDADFWELYEKRYKVLIDKARDFLRHQTERLQSTVNAPQPRGIIFISAGFDASEWEGQGMQRHKVNVPTDFYDRFTRDIMAMSREPGLAIDGRVVSVLEGGYSDRALTSGVMSHLSGLMSLDQSPHAKDRGVEDQMERVSIADTSGNLQSQAWSPSSLDELDAAADPTAPAAPRKPRGPINPTYSTPTQSSTAKMHPIAAARRSLPTSSEPAPPPTVAELAPSIGWAVAAQELSKVLVPDRQVRSCGPEDLNAEATRLRRERQSTLGALPTPTEEDFKPMQLRGRKPKAQGDEQSRSSRRTTIEGSELAELITADATPRPVRAPRRRVSVASTILSTTEEAPDMPVSMPERRRSSRRSSSATAQSSLEANRQPAAPRSRPGSRTGKTSRPGSRTGDSQAGSRTGSRTGSRAGSPSKPRVRRTPAKAPARALAASRANSTKDVDAISAGMKKMSIKLNLGPKPEPAGKQEAEPKRKAVRAPRKATASSKGSKQSTPISTPTETSAGGFPDLTVQHHASSLSTSPASAARDTSAGSQAGFGADESSIITPVTSNEQTQRPFGPVVTDASDKVNPVSSAPPISAAAQLALKEGAITGPDSPADPTTHRSEPAASTASPPAPLQPPITRPSWTSAPPLTKPGTPKAVRQQLPVFTSRSPIPFGGKAKAAPPVFPTEGTKLDPHGLPTPTALLQQNPSGINGSTGAAGSEPSPSS